MRKEKEQAIKLRLSGKSYSQISAELSLPKSTLSGWLGKIVLSDDARHKINKRSREGSRLGLLRRNKNQTHLAQERARVGRETASQEIPPLSRRDILVIGTALYWAEGYKRPVRVRGREVTSHVVSLTNSDPALVKLFLRFLREAGHVPDQKIKAGLPLFKHQNESFMRRFWEGETGIPSVNFGKTYYGISISSMGKRPFNQLPHGIIQIVVADTKLFYRIMGYIDGLKKLV